MHKEKVNKFIKEFSNLIVNVDMFEEKMNYCKSWDVFYLYSGYPEIIVYIMEVKELDIDLEWNDALKEYIKRFRSNLCISDEYLNNKPGILNGYCGIGYMLLSLSQNGVNVGKLLNSVNKRIKVILEKKVDTAKNNIKNMEVTYSDYDVIDGLASSLRYLLEFKDLDIFKSLVREIILYLIEITKINKSMYPNWYIGVDNLSEVRAQMYPNGVIDYGVSHGIAGVLSSLSIAVLNGIEVQGIKESIAAILDIYNSIMITDKSICYWPGILSKEDYSNNKISEIAINYGWCYGIVGTARAIYLGGQAINKSEYIDMSINALKKLCENIDNINMETFILCHGYSGMLLVLNEMYADTGIELFKKTADMIVDNILCNIKNEEILNFNRDVKDIGQQKIDLLQGIIGIALALVNYNDIKKNFISRVMLIR